MPRQSVASCVELHVHMVCGFEGIEPTSWIFDGNWNWNWNWTRTGTSGATLSVRFYTLHRRSILWSSNLNHLLDRSKKCYLYLVVIGIDFCHLLSRENKLKPPEPEKSPLSKHDVTSTSSSERILSKPIAQNSSWLRSSHGNKSQKCNYNIDSPSRIVFCWPRSSHRQSSILFCRKNRKYVVNQKSLSLSSQIYLYLLALLRFL